MRGVRPFQVLVGAGLRRTLPASRGEGGLLSALTLSWTNRPCTPRRNGWPFLHPLPRLENKSLMVCPSSLSSPAFVGHSDVPLLLEVSACPSRHEDVHHVSVEGLSKSWNSVPRAEHVCSRCRMAHAHARCLHCCSEDTPSAVRRRGEAGSGAAQAPRKPWKPFSHPGVCCRLGTAVADGGGVAAGQCLLRLPIQNKAIYLGTEMQWARQRFRA